jgi:hypothetical protein
MKKTILVALLGVTLFSCKKQSSVDETSTESYTITIDSMYIDEDEPTDEEVAKETLVAKEVRYWSSTETKLPKGVVYTTDCASRGTSEQKAKDNYVTIKRPNGYLTIVKDIDEDLFLNLHDGDIIE